MIMNTLKHLPICQFCSQRQIIKREENHLQKCLSPIYYNLMKWKCWKSSCIKLQLMYNFQSPVFCNLVSLKPYKGGRGNCLGPQLKRRVREHVQEKTPSEWCNGHLFAGDCIPPSLYVTCSDKNWLWMCRSGSASHVWVSNSFCDQCDCFHDSPYQCDDRFHNRTPRLDSHQEIDPDVVALGMSSTLLCKICQDSKAVTPLHKWQKLAPKGFVWPFLSQRKWKRSTICLDCGVLTQTGKDKQWPWSQWDYLHE